MSSSAIIASVTDVQITGPCATCGARVPLQEHRFNEGPVLYNREAWEAFRGRKWRVVAALYFDGKDRVNFCGAACSLAYASAGIPTGPVPPTPTGQ